MRQYRLANVTDNGKNTTEIMGTAVRLKSGSHSVHFELTDSENADITEGTLTPGDSISMRNGRRFSRVTYQNRSFLESFAPCIIEVADNFLPITHVQNSREFLEMDANYYRQGIWWNNVGGIRAALIIGNPIIGDPDPHEQKDVFVTKMAVTDTRLSVAPTTYLGAQFYCYRYMMVGPTLSAGQAGFLQADPDSGTWAVSGATFPDTNWCQAFPTRSGLSSAYTRSCAWVMAAKKNTSGFWGTSAAGRVNAGYGYMLQYLGSGSNYYAGTGDRGEAEFIFDFSANPVELRPGEAICIQSRHTLIDIEGWGEWFETPSVSYG